MEKIKNEIATLLNNYDRRLKKKIEERKEVQEEEDIFFKEFGRLRVEVIKPVMDQIGSELKERGHDYSIEEEERKDSQGRKRDAYIIMSIFPSEAKRHEYGPSTTPYIMFNAIRYKKVIMVSGGNMMPTRGSGSAGPRGEFRIDQINKDSIAQEILKMLKEIFER